jgi:hypothetical protein
MEQLMMAALNHAWNQEVKNRPLTGWEKDRLRAKLQSELKTQPDLSLHPTSS